MNSGFMGSGVFGNRMGARVPIRGVAYPKKTYALGQGVSRTDGVAPEPSGNVLCRFLRDAISANGQGMEGPEWEAFLAAMDRVRPPEVDKEQWIAKVYHQLALLCPNEVARLRSIPG